MRRFGLAVFIVLMVLSVTGCGKKSGLEGKVVDGKGKPIANLKIIAKQVQPIKGYEHFEATTDSDGTFSFGKLFPTSKYILFPWFDDWSSAPQRTLKYEANKLRARFNKEGWTTEDKMKVQSGPEGQTTLLTAPMVIQPCISTVTGKLVDGRKRPMQGIKVIAKQVQPIIKGYEQFEATTGADGSFSFKKLFPTSKYILFPWYEDWEEAPMRTLKHETNKLVARFNKEGWTTEKKMKVQSDPEEQTLMLTSPMVIQPCISTVTGKLMDSRKRPMQGIKVIAKQVQPIIKGYEQFEATTGADGSFSFEKLFPFSEYTLIAIDESWKTNVLRKITTTGEQGTFKTNLTVRFTLANGVVNDLSTGLQWAAKDNDRGIKWYNARAYCQNYSGSGHTDWRLPTVSELRGLYNAGIRYKQGDIINITYWCLWASETRGSEAAYFTFGDGRRHWAPQSFGDHPPLFSRALPVRSVKYSKKSLATQKLYNFFDVFKAVAVERNVEKMRNLIHPLYLSCVSDKEYQNMINRYFDIFNKNMKIKEVKIEDISKKELPEAIIKKDLEMAAFPDKRISFSYRGEVAGGVYRGGRTSILLSLHNGEWKWVPFCSLPSVNK